MEKVIYDLDFNEAIDLEGKMVVISGLVRKL